jgi:hypothetical protein
LSILREKGFADENLYDRKPKTLTAIEKMLGKKAFAEYLASEIIKPLGKPTVVPESDNREPYNKAAADFAGVV